MKYKFVVKIVYLFFQEGKMNKITEHLLVQELTFGSAEEAAYHYAKDRITTDFSVEAISRVSFQEMFDNDEDENFYEIKVKAVMISDEEFKEKESTVNFLIRAKSTKDAINILEEKIDDWYNGFSIVATKQSVIFEICPPVPVKSD